VKKTILQLSYDIKRIRRYRISSIITKILIKLSLILIAVICFPISLTLHILGFRIASPFTSRIGHLAIEPDCIIKEIRLNNINLDPKKILLLSPKKICANRHLDSYWGNIFTVIRSPTLIWLLRGLSLFKVANLQTKKFIRNIGGSQSCFQIYSNWGGHMPILSLSTDDELYWNNLSRELGLPKNAWFVSLHVRDAGYKRESHPNSDEYDSYRNADVDTYYEAISAIIKRGGYVIRVGDPKMKPIRKMEGLIDYAKSEVRSNRLDVFLFSQCRFFIGTSSGPILTPFLFGTPVVGTNYAPITARLHAGNSLVIHKLIRDVEKNRILTFEEALSSDIGRGFTSHFYKSKGLVTVDNSPSEITEVTIEMLDFLEGNLQYSEEDEIAQDKINSMYFLLSGYGNLGRVGQVFLRNVVQQGLLT